ncbi:MAG: uncharacterized protein A8A55_2835, partial [Amphiamblys sp. WSBS2006]
NVSRDVCEVSAKRTDTDCECSDNDRNVLHDSTTPCKLFILARVKHGDKELTRETKQATLTEHSVPKDCLNADISEEELRLANTKSRYWKSVGSDGIPRGYTRRHSRTRLSSATCSV